MARATDAWHWRSKHYQPKGLVRTWPYVLQAGRGNPWGTYRRFAFAFGLAHGSPFVNGLDLASPILAVGAMGASLGLAKHPLVKLLLAACAVAEGDCRLVSADERSATIVPRAVDVETGLGDCRFCEKNEYIIC